MNKFMKQWDDNDFINRNFGQLLEDYRTLFVYVRMDV